MAADFNVDKELTYYAVVLIYNQRHEKLEILAAIAAY